MYTSATFALATALSSSVTTTGWENLQASPLSQDPVAWNRKHGFKDLALLRTFLLAQSIDFNSIPKRAARRAAFSFSPGGIPNLSALFSLASIIASNSPATFEESIVNVPLLTATDMLSSNPVGLDTTAEGTSTESGFKDSEMLLVMTDASKNKRNLGYRGHFNKFYWGWWPSNSHKCCAN